MSHQTFVTSFRRVLYLQKIFGASLDWLAMDNATPSNMKAEIKNIQNAMKRLTENSRHRAFMHAGNDENWRMIYTELNGEHVQDVLLLLDTVMNVKNVDAITEIISQNKVAAA